MKRKGIVIFILFAMLFSIHTSVFADDETSISDIDNHWAKEEIKFLVEKGAISGYTNNTFRPDDYITRAEAVKMLIILMGPDPDPDGYVKLELLDFAIEKRLIERSLYYALEDEKQLNSGIDENGKLVYQEFQSLGNKNGITGRNVLWGTGKGEKYALEGHWADKYMLDAIKRGYVLWGNIIVQKYDSHYSGYEGKEYLDLNSEVSHYVKELLFIDKPISRGELSRLLIRALDTEYSYNLQDYSSQMKDYEQISVTYRDYVVEAYAKNIFTLYEDGTFKADKSVTRAEACKVFSRFLTLLSEKDAIDISSNNKNTERYITRAEAVKMILMAQEREIKKSLFDTVDEDTAYFLEAEKKGFFKNSFFSSERGNKDELITRLELAVLLANALNEEYPYHIEKYIMDLNGKLYDPDILKHIRDYNGIRYWSQYSEASEFPEEAVLRIYFKGIMAVRPDKTFKPNDKVTETEFDQTLERFLDPSKRIVVDPKQETTPSYTYDNFIEPKFYVIYPDHIGSYKYFYISVDNFSEYENAEEYFFNIDIISHPEIKLINLRDYSKPEAWEERIIESYEFNTTFSTKDKPHKDKNGEITHYTRGIFYGQSGEIYNLGMNRGWKPSTSNTYFNIKDGEILKYKITVSNSKISKEYFIDVEFRDKYFNIFN